jgi:hypothetical protein
MAFEAVGASEGGKEEERLGLPPSPEHHWVRMVSHKETELKAPEK